MVTWIVYIKCLALWGAKEHKGRGILHHQSFRAELCATFWKKSPDHSFDNSKYYVATISYEMWEFKWTQVNHLNWSKVIKMCFFGRGFAKGTRIVVRRALKNESRSLYVAGQIREINVLATVAASLQSLSTLCRLHVARLKRYFIEVWGRGGRRPSSLRGHIFCPIRLIPVWMADLSNPVTWLTLYTCSFCVRPRWSPWPRLSLWIFPALCLYRGLRRGITECIPPFVSQSDPGQLYPHVADLQDVQKTKCAVRSVLIWSPNWDWRHLSDNWEQCHPLIVATIWEITRAVCF